MKTGVNSWYKFKSTAFYTELRKNVYMPHQLTVHGWMLMNGLHAPNPISFVSLTKKMLISQLLRARLVLVVE